MGKKLLRRVIMLLLLAALVLVGVQKSIRKQNCG